MRANVRARRNLPAPRSLRIAALFIAAVLVTLIFRAALPPAWRVNESADYSRFYEPVARNLLAGHGLTLADGTPATEYPPGYSIVLAGLFWLSSALGVAEGTLLAVFHALAMGVTSVLLYALARPVWGRRAAVMPPLLWMTYPFTLWLTKQPNSEIPFLVAFYGAWYLFWDASLRQSRAWAIYSVCGLLVGITMLIRPIALGLGLVLGGLLWVTRRDLEPRIRGLLVGALLAGNLLAVLPWETWTFHRTGRLVLLGDKGPASIGDGLTFAVHAVPGREPVKLPAGMEAVQRAVMTDTGPPTSLSYIARALGAQLRERPVAVAELVALKAARSWYGTDSGRLETAILLIQAAYLAVILWASWAAWKLGSAARQLAMSGWVLTLYFWAMNVGAASIVRYMVPAFGLLFLLLPARIKADEGGEAPTPAGGT